MSRFERMFEESIEGAGYRISPRAPLRYRVARFLQRMYKDTRGVELGVGYAEILAGMLQLSVNMGVPMTMEYYTDHNEENHTRVVTRLRAYPDGGVSLVKYRETLPHHPMRLRSHARREAEGSS